jgi:N-methylhydantoinase A
METEAKAILRSEGFSDKQQRHERSLAMRYRGQSFELEVRQTSGDLSSAFHQVHHDRYGYSQEQSEVEIVSARLRSSGIVRRLKANTTPLGPRRQVKPHKVVTAYLSGKRTQVGVYQREELKPGARLQTPCIVAEYSATTLIPGDVKAELDRFGNLLMRIGV